MEEKKRFQDEIRIEQLQIEEDFLRYVEQLKYFAKNYTVMIAACDTPWGPILTPKMTYALKEIGLTVDLYEKFRLGYAAVIDTGMLVFEKLSPSVMEIVERTITLGEDEIELLSVGFERQRRAYIKINGKVVSTEARGLNFVVYDKKEKVVLDAVNFDMFSQDFVGNHLIAREKIVQDYLKEHPGTTFACFNTPVFLMMENLTKNEMFIGYNNLNLQMILENLDKPFFSINSYYDMQDVSEILSLPNVDKNTDGIRYMQDQQGNLVNIKEGKRVTELQLERRKRTVFLLGNENVFGVGVSDLHTMASFLQTLFHQYLPEEEILVENYGHYFENGLSLKELKAILYALPVCPQGGDIILWNTEKIPNIPFIDMAAASVVTRDVELFLDKMHYTPHGHKLIADRLYQGMIEQKLLPIPYLQGDERVDYLPSVMEQGLSVSDLRAERDFKKYLTKLKEFAEKYTICIVSSGTCCGAGVTSEVVQLLQKLGLEIDLCDKINHAYVAVLDAGKPIFEEVSSMSSSVVEKILYLMGNRIELRSWAYGSVEMKETYIKWNGEQIASVERGLSFVVYDKASQIVLDAVNFDIRYESGTCFRISEDLELLEDYRKQHPDVVICGFGQIAFPQKNLTKYEKWVVEAIFYNKFDPEYILHEYYDKDGIAEVLSVPPSYHDSSGIRHFYDMQGKLVNMIGGHRVTGFQPKHPKRSIFVVGGCNIFGVGVSDTHTVASALQKILNQNDPDEAISVKNYGYFLAETDRQSNEMVKILKGLPVKSGDIVFFEGYIQDIPFIDMSMASAEPRSYEIFRDMGHYTPDGHNLAAKKLYEGILQHDLLAKAKEAEKNISLINTEEDYMLDANDTSELAEYKRELIEFYRELYVITEGAVSQQVFGTIVMNCNPFTLGHRYLIEQALKQCDYLVIFVVEEDKSIFPFEDRLQLVVEGTADLPNVIVIPSGRFIISSLTFSEYFNKSELQERVVDTSMDVLLFAREIAPCLHIKKRFTGEEPFDAVTRQYNESMGKILPEHGIEFIEIPRAGVDGEVISASRVRALLEKKEFDAVQALVPDTTFRYLIEKFQ